MNQNEKFCLKWNDFHENIGTTFSGLRDVQDFSDVTLACEDNIWTCKVCGKKATMWRASHIPAPYVGRLTSKSLIVTSRKPNIPGQENH